MSDVLRDEVPDCGPELHAASDQVDLLLGQVVLQLGSSRKSHGGLAVVVSSSSLGGRHGEQLDACGVRSESKIKVTTGDAPTCAQLCAKPSVGQVTVNILGHLLQCGSLHVALLEQREMGTELGVNSKTFSHKGCFQLFGSSKKFSYYVSDFILSTDKSKVLFM